MLQHERASFSLPALSSQGVLYWTLTLCIRASSLFSGTGPCSDRPRRPTKDHGVSVSELLGVAAGSKSLARVQRRSTSKSMTTQYRVVTSTLSPSMYPW